MSDPDEVDVFATDDNELYIARKEAINRFQGQSYNTGQRSGRRAYQMEVLTEGKKRIAESIQLTNSGASVDPKFHELAKFLKWVEDKNV